METIHGNKVELQGSNQGISIYKTENNQIWYVVQDNKVVFELHPVADKSGGTVILTEFVRKEDVEKGLHNPLFVLPSAAG